MEILLIAFGAMGGLGAMYALCLTFADSKLRVDDDPRIESIMDVLPMTNCGACGTPGCLGFAEAIVEDKVSMTACAPGGQQVIDDLAEILGVDSVDEEKMIAVLLCQGGDKETRKSVEYRGEKTCLSANLTGGEKDCAYACHGHGDCVVSCEFDAMVMNDNGLPVIFYDKCVGCTDCAEICPRDLIEMHPPEHKLFVYCKNEDKGATAKKACDVACIACNLCVQDCSVDDAIIIDNNLAIIDFVTTPQNDESIGRCPTKCILFDEEKDKTSDNYFGSLMDDAG